MKIYPFCMTCVRDLDLLKLMLKSYYALKPAEWHGEPIISCEEEDFERVFLEASNAIGRDAYVHQRPKGFNGGCGWDAAMNKLQELKQFYVREPELDVKSQYLLMVDSDVVFCSDKWVPVSCEAGVWGLPHIDPVPHSGGPLGGLKFLSGGMWLCRFDVLDMMVNLGGEQWDRFRSWMVGANLTQNEDVVLSLMAQYLCRNKLGAIMGHWTGREFFAGDPHCLVDGGWRNLGAVHLNTEQKVYAECDIKGKWEIPSVLKDGDIKPWSDML